MRQNHCKNYKHSLSNTSGKALFPAWQNPNVSGILISVSMFNVRVFSIFTALIAVAFSLFTLTGKAGNDLLTAEERAWLTKNQSHIVLAVETSSAPFVFIDSKGNETGLASEYISLVEAKLGVKFQRKRYRTFNDILMGALKGEIQIVNAISPTPFRQTFLNFTNPYLLVPDGIIVRKDNFKKINEQNLNGLRISIVRGYDALIDYLRTKNINYTSDLVDNDFSALADVSFGHSDAAIIDFATASYLISEHSIANLKLADEIPYNIKLAIGSSKKEPMLQTILQKGLNAISKAERTEIHNRWFIKTNNNVLNDRRTRIIAIAILIAIIGTIVMILLWNRTLRRKVATRTLALHTEKEALRKSEEKYRNIYDNMQDVYFEVELDGIVIQINPVVEIMTKGLYNAGEIIGRSMYDFLADEETRRIFLSTIKEHGRILNLETVLKNKDGSIISTIISAKLCYDSGGIAEKIIGTIHDISGLKNAENALKAEESMMKAITGAAQDAIFVIDAAGCISFFNAAAEQLFGYSRQEMMGKNLHQLIAPPRFQSASEIGLNQFVASGATPNFYNLRELQALNKDGREIQVEVSLSALDLPDGRYAVGIVRDITQRKQAEESLRESEEKFKYVFEAANVGKTITSLSGEISVNKAFCDWLGYSHDQLTNTKWQDLTPPEEIKPVQEILSSMIGGTNDSARFRARYRHQNGSYKWADVNVVLRRNTQGEPIHFITTLVDITEHKKASDALKESEKMYRNLIEKMPDGVYKSTHDGSFLEVNPAMVKLLGYDSKEELLAIDIKSQLYFEPSERESLVLEQQLIEMGIYRLRKKDGSEIWVEDHGWYTPDESGNGPVHEGVLRDVSERIAAENALRESEEKFKNLAESSPFAIMIFQDDKWIYCNPAGTEITGYLLSELEHMDFWEFVHPDDSEIVKERGFKRQSGQNTERTYEFRIIDRDGRIKWVMLTGSSIVYKGKPAAMISVADVSERKQAETALRESEQSYIVLFNSVPEAIFIQDGNGKIIDMNAGAESMFGYTHKELEGNTFGLLSATEKNSVQLISDQFASVFDTGKLQQFEFWGKNKSNEEFPLDVISDKGKYFGKDVVITTARNIADRKNAEEEIIHLNESLENRVLERTSELQAAIKEMEAFSYSISHDLRTPLRALDGYANFLIEDYSSVLDEEAKRMLRIIIQNANRMGQLIDDLLSFSKLSRYAIKKSRIDMEEMANSVFIELTAENEDKTIDFRLQNIPSAVGDAAMMRQVWTNLISNAIKYSAKKTHRVIEVAYLQTENEHIYSVKDNGAGFNMAYYDKLFGVFQRLHTVKDFEGTGIGLAIVNRIIQRHSGHLWAEGEVDKGATFYFSLPVKSE